jgi:glycosyltransferase involved in cell wall biosynthesis
VNIKMRILHIVGSYYPNIGGLEAAVKHLAEGQAELGHQVTVLTSNVNGWRKEEIINGVRIVRVKAKNIIYKDLTIPLEEPQVKSIEIVHAHSQNSLFSIMMAEKLKKKLNVKMAFYFMAVDAFRDHPSTFVRLLGPYYGRKNIKRALKITDLILVKSIRDLTILKEVYDVKATYLPDAIPSYYFSIKKGDPNEFRAKFGIKQEKIFLFIGRMHRLKGPHILVEALKYVDENIAAVFIGPDGGYLNEILNLADKIGVRNKVYTLGFVDEKIKIQAIDSALALVLPSIADYSEVYSIVTSEAWAREKPVIASMVGELPYRIANGVNGLLFEPSNPKSLANAMLKLLVNNGLANEMGKNGKKNVHTWSEVAAKSIEIYGQACGL